MKSQEKGKITTEIFCNGCKKKIGESVVDNIPSLLRILHRQKDYCESCGG